MSATIPSSAQPVDLSAVRVQLHSRDDYLGALPPPVALDMFSWKEDITAGNADVLSFNDGTSDLAGAPAYVSMVGLVLADRPYLAPQGNYNASYGHNFCDAKLQFTVGSAASVLPGLGEDFDNAVRVVEALQHKGASTPAHNHLMRLYRNRKGVRMSFPMFSLRNGPSADNDGTLRHPVPQDMVPALQAASASHALNPLPFFDEMNVRIGAPFLEKHLVGAVVEVWFCLHHWAVTAKGGKPVISDTFQAKLGQVRVLRRLSQSSVGSPFTNPALSTPCFPSSSSAKLARARAALALPSTPPTMAVTMLTPPETPESVASTNAGLVLNAGPSTPSQPPPTAVPDTASLPTSSTPIPPPPAPPVAVGIHSLPPTRTAPSLLLEGGVPSTPSVGTPPPPTAVESQPTECLEGRVPSTPSVGTPLPAPTAVESQPTTVHSVSDVTIAGSEMVNTLLPAIDLQVCDEGGATDSRDTAVGVGSKAAGKRRAVGDAESVSKRTRR